MGRDDCAGCQRFASFWMNVATFMMDVLDVMPVQGVKVLTDVNVFDSENKHNKHVLGLRCVTHNDISTPAHATKIFSPSRSP